MGRRDGMGFWHWHRFYYRLNWEEGRSVPEIADLLDCKPSQIRAVMREHRVPVRSTNISPRALPLWMNCGALVRELYWKQWRSVREIAAEHGVSARCVYAIMATYGISRDRYRKDRPKKEELCRARERLWLVKHYLKTGKALKPMY